MLDTNTIIQFASTLDDHLRKLEGMTGILREVKATLEELRLSQEQNYLYELQKVKREILDLTSELRKHGLPESSQYERELSAIREFLTNGEWPLAVDPSCIANNEEKINKRADAVLDMFVGSVKGKKFLDYGCGDGINIEKALQREADLAVGYDVDPSKTKLESPLFEHNFEKIRSMGPFDVVLINDVLDHIVMIDPIQAMRQVRSVVAPKGRVFLRCHPWSSRHGGHIYMRENKAFLHLIFDQTELLRIGGWSADHNIKVINPIDTYRFWFSSSGFKIKSEIPIVNKVEEFFLKPSIINERLIKIWPNEEEMRKNLEISFVEYVLEASDQQVF